MSLNPLALWEQMTILNKGVIIILIILSIWSLYVSVERLIMFSKARKQSLLFARQATEHLKNDRPQAAIDAASKYPQSHLARVVSAGLQSFQYESQTSPLSAPEVVEAATRAVERATLLTTSDLKRGIGSLATIATITPFIGLFGTVIGIINAFTGMALAGSGGIGAVSAGIAEALVATAFGLGVAIPAAWMFNYFTNKLERLQIEMSNSASELVDFFMKRQRSKNAA
ncbi:MAG TPA: MotA/TolQ/ExbB proton channel family protein [Thermoanaerobaculia bacterium]|jgi:biopolymer transport protein ExbB/biopolymer transport protein TolQ|nr:MotA/TolQ/ExbB proton channel family protein [Thermoanaerobaculia bacterium]